MLIILFVTYGTLFTLGLVDNSRGVLYPQILEYLGVGPAVGSWMFTAASIAAVICAGSSRVWLKYFGVLGSLRFFLTVQFFGCLILGNIDYMFTDHSYFVLIISALLMGGSFGGLGLILNLIISKEVSIKNRKRALSGLHASYGAASFLAPIAAFVVTVKLGDNWSRLFLYASFLPFILFISSFWCKIKKVTTRDDRSGNFKLKLSLGLFAAFMVAAELSISTRVVYYASEIESTLMFAPKTYLAIFFFLLLTGRALFFFFHFPGSSTLWPMLSIVFTFVFYTLGLMFDPLFLAFCGLTMSIFFPCFIDYVSESVKATSLDGTISFIMTTVGVLLIGMNWVIGMLAESFGIVSALYLGPVCILVAFVLFFIVKSKVKMSIA